MYKNLSPRALGFAGIVPSEIIELALSYGFKGMDLDLVDFGQSVAANGLDKSRRLIDSAKLKIGNFLLPIDWLAEETRFKIELVRLGELLPLAKALGCERALAIMKPASDERPYHENFEFHRKRLAELGRALEPHGIRLAVEFMGPSHLRRDKQFEFIHDLNAALTLVGMIPAKNVGLLVDVWHLHTSGGSIEDIRKIPLDRIVSVQLADAPADVPPEACENGDRRLPGETGVIDCAAALAILAEMGYDGPVTPEPLAKRLTGISRQAAVKLVGESLEGVWKAAGLSPEGKLSAIAAG